MCAELADRHAKMQVGARGLRGLVARRPIHGRWRPWRGESLCSMVQASAGTDKPSLSTTMLLWCVANDKNAKAVVRTEIAGKHVEIEAPDACASTTRAISGLNAERKARLDLAHQGLRSDGHGIVAARGCKRD